MFAVLIEYLNPAVATVDPFGVVTPLSTGTTTIRVTNQDGAWDEVPITITP